MLILSIVLLVGDALIGFVVYNRMQSLFMEKVQENAKNLAQCAASFVDGDEFARVTEGDEEAYEHVLDTLSGFLDNSTLQYVYSYGKDAQDNVIFVVDADPDEPAEVGEIYDEELEGLDLAFAGTANADEEPSSDEWGTYVSAYCPVFDGPEVVGVVGVDVDYMEIEDAVRRMLWLIVGICGGVYVLLLAALIIIGRKMSGSFKVLNDKICELADGSGDLNKNIDIHTGDEFEVIGGSVNTFIGQLKGLISQISDNSHENAESIRAINDNTHTISANMEECAAGTDAISKNLSDTASAIEQLAKDVETANDQITAASLRAGKSAELAASHKLESESKIEELQSGISAVVEQAEAVKQVRKIGEEIMAIVRQTRILSLNAQVEAARAGEQGRGFAVVATEVAALSEEISDSVEHIDEINGKVLEAMTGMVEYLNNVSDFMNGAVMSDYVAFAETGKDCGDTTERIREWMENMKNQSAHMAANVVGVSDSVKEIVCAITESAGQVERLHGSTMDISEKIGELLENPIIAES